MERWPLWAGRGVVWQFLFVESTTCLLFQLHAYTLLRRFLWHLLQKEDVKHSKCDVLRIWTHDEEFFFFWKYFIYLYSHFRNCEVESDVYSLPENIFLYYAGAIVKSFPISMLHFLDSPRSCIPGRASFNVTLTEGTQAGMFRYMGKNFNISECIHHACALGYGDYVYMIEDICFVVECYPEKKCDLKNSPESTDTAVPLKWSGKTANWKKVERKQNHQCAFSLNSASFSEAAILLVSC